MIVGLNHVSIPARDLDVSLRFYTEIFGLEQVPSPNFGFRVDWLRVGDLQIHLFPDAEAPRCRNHFSFTVDNWQDLYVRAGELGALVDEAPFAQTTELPDGGAQMYLRDPAGNLIELDMPDASLLDRDIVTIRRLVDVIPQDEGNLRATLFLPRQQPA